MTDLEPLAREVDSVGRRCPLPVIDLARAVSDVPVGALLAVVADDEAAAHDVPAWCRMKGHAYVGTRERTAGTAYVVRRLV